jgi:signal transduction histidine kinase
MSTHGPEPGLQASPAQAERLHHFAHDLRNRLAGMQQVLRMMAAPEPRQDTPELTVFAEQQFFKAMRCVEDLLDDLGVERGTPPLATVEVDLSATVREAVRQLEHRFSRKHQPVDLRVPPTCIAMADPQHAERIVSSLLSNASKFSKPGDTIEVVLLDSDHEVLLHVRDHGTGLNPMDLAQVFVRYAMLSSRSTAGEEQGRSTLGRARQWARAMGGDLLAESPGKEQGSTFTLRLRKA